MTTDPTRPPTGLEPVIDEKSQTATTPSKNSSPQQRYPQGASSSESDLEKQEIGLEDKEKQSRQRTEEDESSLDIEAVQDDDEDDDDDAASQDKQQEGGGRLSKVVSRVLSRTSTKSSHWNPGPPPDGGLKAWLVGTSHPPLP